MKLQTMTEKIKNLPWRKMRWGILAGIGVLLLVAGGLFFYFGKAQTNTASSAAAKAAYYTAKVSRGNLRVTATGSGTLTTNQEIDISFSTEGKISELDVKVGDQVTKGQVLAKLSETDKLEATIANDNLTLLEAQQTLQELKDKAQVTLSTAFQTYITAQQTYADAITSQQKTGNSRCSKTSNASYQEKYQKAKDDLDAITKRDYGSEAWIEAKNVYDIALANLEYCLSYTADEKVSANATLGVSKVALDKAEADYNTLKENKGLDPNTLAIDEAAVKAAETQLASDKASLESITLTAPIDGVITSIAKNVGAIMDTSTFIKLADTSGSAVSVQINQTNQDVFVVGTKAEVVFDALPNNTFTGTVTMVKPTLVASGENQVVEGTIQLDQKVTDDGNFVPFGLDGTVTLLVSEADNALVVPLDALRDLGDSQYGVFVVDKNKQLTLKTVTVGVKTSSLAEIKSGLNENDIVSTGAVKTNY